MKYSSAQSFTAALHVFMRREAEQRTQAIQRVRHEVAFDRVLARLLAVDAEAWLLKGGVALEYRLPPSISRATVDVDIAITKERQIEPLMAAAVELDLGDYFTMGVAARPYGELLDELNVHRFKIRLDLAGKMFDAVAVDISVSDGICEAPEILSGRSLLAFAGIEPLRIPAIPVEQHLAEKLHAYVRTYGVAFASSRVKDLVDIIILAQHRSVSARSLKAAILVTFARRANADLPTTLPPPPMSWERRYRELAAELPIPPMLADGFAVAESFFDLILTMDGEAENMVWVK